MNRRAVSIGIGTDAIRVKVGKKFFIIMVIIVHIYPVLSLFLGVLHNDGARQNRSPNGSIRAARCVILCDPQHFNNNTKGLLFQDSNACPDGIPDKNPCGLCGSKKKNSDRNK